MKKIFYNFLYFVKLFFVVFICCYSYKAVSVTVKDVLYPNKYNDIFSYNERFDLNVGYVCLQTYKINSICFPKEATLQDDGNCKCEGDNCSTLDTKSYFKYYPINLINKVGGNNIPLEIDMSLHYKHPSNLETCGENQWGDDIFLKILTVGFSNHKVSGSTTKKFLKNIKFTYHQDILYYTGNAAYYENIIADNYSFLLTLENKKEEDGKTYKLLKAKFFIDLTVGYPKLIKHCDYVEGEDVCTNTEYIANLLEDPANPANGIKIPTIPFSERFFPHKYYLPAEVKIIQKPKLEITHSNYSSFSDPIIVVTTIDDDDDFIKNATNVEIETATSHRHNTVRYETSVGNYNDYWHYQFATKIEQIGLGFPKICVYNCYKNEDDKCLNKIGNSDNDKNILEYLDGDYLISPIGSVNNRIIKAKKTYTSEPRNNNAKHCLNIINPQKIAISGRGDFMDNDSYNNPKISLSINEDSTESIVNLDKTGNTMGTVILNESNNNYETITNSNNQIIAIPKIYSIRQETLEVVANTITANNKICLKYNQDCEVLKDGSNIYDNNLYADYICVHGLYPRQADGELLHPVINNENILIKNDYIEQKYNLNNNLCIPAPTREVGTNPITAHKVGNTYQIKIDYQEAKKFGDSINVQGKMVNRDGEKKYNIHFLTLPDILKASSLSNVFLFNNAISLTKTSEIDILTNEVQFDYYHRYKFISYVNHNIRKYTINYQKYNYITNSYGVEKEILNLDIPDIKIAAFRNLRVKKEGSNYKFYLKYQEKSIYNEVETLGAEVEVELAHTNNFYFYNNKYDVKNRFFFIYAVDNMITDVKYNNKLVVAEFDIRGIRVKLEKKLIDNYFLITYKLYDNNNNIVSAIELIRETITPRLLKYGSINPNNVTAYRNGNNFVVTISSHITDKYINAGGDVSGGNIVTNTRKYIPIKRYPQDFYLDIGKYQLFRRASFTSYDAYSANKGECTHNVRLSLYKGNDFKKHLPSTSYSSICYNPY